MEKLALSIAEFCGTHNISRSTFYNMVKDGTGPRTMKVRGRTLVSNEAAAEWRRQCESASRPADKQAA